jgi:LemA protein
MLPPTAIRQPPPWEYSMLLTSLTIFGAAAALLLWAIAIYNGLIKLRNMKEEAWSGIDVQLKRRSDLIPNLLEAVKGYMGHERAVLEQVTSLRARSMNASTIGDKIAAESALTRSLGALFAVAENYPDLKANQNFLDLQNQLSQLENEIQMARRYYNGTVRNLNVAIETFPNSIVAGMFNFSKAEFFEIEDEADRALPKVDFSAPRQ